jgi:hypothetical protein
VGLGTAAVLCEAIAVRTSIAPAPFLFPTKGTCCGLPLLLSLTETAPLEVPELNLYLKATVMVHDPFAATLLPQVFVWEKAVEPAMLMLLIMRVVLPVFVSAVV